MYAQVTGAEAILFIPFSLALACKIDWFGTCRYNLKGICPRGNNKVVIILFHVNNRCLFFMLELY
jgi:hypothetical protein